MEDLVIPNEPFWRGKRVLVTGHSGFKGAWLCLWLDRLGAQVTGLGLPPETDPSLFALVKNALPIESVFCDIRDAEAVRRVVVQSRADVLFHLAAQALVRRSYEHPIATLATNVMGTAHVLEAARASGNVRAVVVVTSDKCYENREWDRPYREQDPMGGFDPYSCSKGCAELVTAAWRRSFFNRPQSNGVGVASARAGNVIGGGDWSCDRLVPDCARAFMAGQAVLIRRPQAIRPWQHVLEPLAGYLSLAEQLWRDPAMFGEAWNFGPPEDDARSVAWVVERLARLWGDGAGWQQDAGSHPHEAGVLQVDASKARTRLHWRPQLPIENALEWTVDWYRRVAAGESAGRLTLDQIVCYEGMRERNA